MKLRVALGLLVVSANALCTESLPAFPGAEGFGADTIGGRGGRIEYVTHTGDSGPGSFRNCAEGDGPRICVFKTGGQIELEKSVQIRHPFVTIAGQSAPGGGISIRTKPDNPKAAIIVRTHDVVIRYLRIRPGASYVSGDTQDALTITNSAEPVYNIIVDHTSMSWASDEVANVWNNAYDITFQWNIIAEGLQCMNHPDDGCEHSKGLLVGGVDTYNVSVHHNLLTNHSERSPRMAMTGLADIVNNVIYNPKYSATQVSDRYAVGKVNYVNNYMKKGGNSKSDYMITLKGEKKNGFSLYVAGNISQQRHSIAMKEDLVVKSNGASWNNVSRHLAPAITTHTCESFEDCQVYDLVLATAGANLPKRDAVDKRIVEEVRQGTGKIIDAQSQLGCYLDCKNYLKSIDYSSLGISDPLTSDGWPILSAGKPYPDEDEDGMADPWEISHGLDPTTDDSFGFQLHKGYTNIEVFLDDLTKGI